MRHHVPPQLAGTPQLAIFLVCFAPLQLLSTALEPSGKLHPLLKQCTRLGYASRLELSPLAEDMVFLPPASAFPAANVAPAPVAAAVAVVAAAVAPAAVAAVVAAAAPKPCEPAPEHLSELQSSQTAWPPDLPARAM